MADNKSDIDWSAGIRFSGVTAERGGRAVLRDISLHLKERRIGLIGVNGSGKSSLVRLLNGLLEPRQGSLELFGRAIGERGFRVIVDADRVVDRSRGARAPPCGASAAVFTPRLRRAARRRRSSSRAPPPPCRALATRVV